MNDLEATMMIVVMALVFGGISALIASALKLSTRFWFFLGIVLGPIALLALVYLPESWLMIQSDD